MLTKDETFYVYNTSLVFILLFPWIFELKVNINDIFVTTKFAKYVAGLLNCTTYIGFSSIFCHQLIPLINHWYGILMIETHTHLKNIRKKMCLKRCRALNEIFIVPYSIFDCFEVNTHFYTWILRHNNTTTRFATFITSTNNPFVIAERYIMKGNVLSLFLSKYRKFLWSEMDWTLIGIVD